MCISMTGDIEVLKIGPHAKSDILVKLNLLIIIILIYAFIWLDQFILIALARLHSRLNSHDDDRVPCTL